MATSGHSPFLVVTINGVVVKIMTPSATKVGKASVPEEKLQGLNLQGKEKDGLDVCVTVTVPFPSDKGDLDWGVGVRFLTTTGSDPEYTVGIVSSVMEYPHVFTQNVPVAFSKITGVEFKAMPQSTKRREHRETLLKHLEDVMAEKSRMQEEFEKTTGEQETRANAEELRQLVESRMRNTTISQTEWADFLCHQNRFTVEQDARRELIVSELFSKKKDPYNCTDAPVDYERIIVSKVASILKDHGTLELPLLMELLWTDSDPLLQQATRRVLCPNWKVLKEILYDNKTRFEWKTNHTPPYICLK